MSAGANFGRPDLDQLVAVRHIASEEPKFLLRARDPGAAPAVRFWAVTAHGLGVEAAVLEQALLQADAMDRWPNKRAPDASHLEERDRLQLAYQLSRRAWNWDAPAAPGLDLVLAYRRGWDAALASVRATPRPLTEENT